MDDKTSNKLIGGIGYGTSAISSIAPNAQIGNTAAWDKAIDDANAQQYDYNDFDSLQGAALAQQRVKNVTASDIRGMSEGQAWGNVAKGAGSAFMAGTTLTGNPLVGAAAALGTGLLGWGLKAAGDREAEAEADKLNWENEKTRIASNQAIAHNAQQIGNRTFDAALVNMAAFGGMLDNYDKSRIRLRAYGGSNPTISQDYVVEPLNLVGKGGSHETNPYGGVMLGIDPQGVPNLAEEGETVLNNDYVFSKRLKADGGILDSVKLPKEYEGMSFSEISQKLNEEREVRENDPISKAGFNDAMMKLVTAQEEIRAREQEYENFENLENTFADGGSIHIKPSKRGTFTAAARARGMGVQEFASKVLANKEKYSTAMVKKANFARNAAGWSHALGGLMNTFAMGGDTDEPEVPVVVTDGTTTTATTQNAQQGGRENPVVPRISPEKQARLLNKGIAVVQNPSGLAGAPNRLPLMKPNPFLNPENLKYAPAIGSAIQTLTDSLGWTNKEDYTAPDMIATAQRNVRNVVPTPIGGYMVPQYYDTGYQENLLRNAALSTQRSIYDLSGGNRGTARNSTLALNTNLGNQMGANYRQALESNRENAMNIARFNTGIDQANAQQFLSAQQANQQRDIAGVNAAAQYAKMYDDIQTALSGVRSTNKTALYNNMGQVGTDIQRQKSVLQWLYNKGYGQEYENWVRYGYNAPPATPTTTKSKSSKSITKTYNGRGVKVN